MARIGSKFRGLVAAACTIVVAGCGGRGDPAAPDPASRADAAPPRFSVRETRDPRAALALVPASPFDGLSPSGRAAARWLRLRPGRLDAAGRDVPWPPATPVEGDPSRRALVLALNGAGTPVLEVAPSVPFRDVLAALVTIRARRGFDAPIVVAGARSFAALAAGGPDADGFLSVTMTADGGWGLAANLAPDGETDSGPHPPLRLEIERETLRFPGGDPYGTETAVTAANAAWARCATLLAPTGPTSPAWLLLGVDDRVPWSHVVMTWVVAHAAGRSGVVLPRPGYSLRLSVATAPVADEPAPATSPSTLFGVRTWVLVVAGFVLALVVGGPPWRRRARAGAG